jgi:hypothetical protein
MFPKKEKMVFSLVKSRGHRGIQGCRCILKQSRGLPFYAKNWSFSTKKCSNQCFAKNWQYLEQKNAIFFATATSGSML